MDPLPPMVVVTRTATCRQGHTSISHGDDACEWVFRALKPPSTRGDDPC